MIKAICIKEWKEWLRDGRLRLLIWIVAILLIISGWVSYQYYQSVRKQFAEAALQHRANWEGQTEKNPHAAAHFGTYVFKQKSPLSLLDVGADKYTGIAFYLEPHRRNPAQYSVLQDETSLIRFGDLTPSYVLLYLLPLLTILLGFNVFTKERENNTWKLLLLQNAGKGRIAIGKWLSLLTFAFAFISLVFIMLLFFLPGLEEFSSYSWANAGWLFITYLLYNIVILNITLVVSSSIKKSGLAFLLLMTFWFVTSFLIPKLTANNMGQKYPALAKVEVINMANKLKANGVDGHNAGNDAAKQLEKEVLKQYGVDSLSQLPVNFAGIRLDRGEQLETKAYDSTFNLQKRILEQQFDGFTESAIFSPFTATKLLSMGFSSSDVYYHWHFADAAEKYRRLFVNMMNENIIHHSKTGDTYLAGTELWKSVPEFSYTPPPVAEVVNYQKNNIVILFIWLVASFGLLFFSVNKMRP